MKTSPYSLLVLLTTLALSTSTLIPTWTNCTANFQQWFPNGVTIKQNPNVEEVVTLSACGGVASAGWYTTFNHLQVTGRIGTGYTWNTTVPYHYIESTGGHFCFNYTTYIPDMNQTQVNVSILAIDDYSYQVGCIDILLNNRTLVYN